MLLAACKASGAARSSRYSGNGDLGDNRLFISIMESAAQTGDAAEQVDAAIRAAVKPDI